IPLFGGAEVMKGLADPDNIERLVPGGDGLDEVLTAQINRTGQGPERFTGDFEGWPRDVDSNIAANPRPKPWQGHRQDRQTQTDRALRRPAPDAEPRTLLYAPYSSGPRPSDTSPDLS